MSGVTSNTARRIRKGATLPATCAVGEIFIKSGGGSEGVYACITTANTWVLLDVNEGDGTVTSVSVVSANGLAGSVANPTTTPAITLSTSITGLLKGNGTAVSAAGASDLPSAIDAAKIADGSVSNAEFQRLDATSSIQTQIDTKAADADVVHDTGDETIAGVKTFSSDPLIPDEAYGVGWNGSLEPPTKNAVYDKIETLGGAGYLKYVALLTQSGTDAPVATVLENTLGGTVVWARGSAGSYEGTLAGVFTVNKTAPLAGTNLNVNGDWSMARLRRVDSDVIGLTSIDTGVAGDDLLNNTSIVIYVYP